MLHTSQQRNSNTEKNWFGRNTTTTAFLHSIDLKFPENDSLKCQMTKGYAEAVSDQFRVFMTQ